MNIMAYPGDKDLPQPGIEPLFSDTCHIAIVSNYCSVDERMELLQPTNLGSKK